MTHGYPAEFADRADGNFLLLTKTLLNQADQTLTFSQPAFWTTTSRRFYRALIVTRTALAVLGLAWCLWWWRRLPSARILGLWFICLTLIMLTFFTLFFWQEERFLLRLVPFFCLLTAIGPSALLNCILKSPTENRTAVAVCAVSVLCALLACLTSFSVFNSVVVSDDNLNVFEAMRNASNIMESNAVVVTNWDPFRSHLYVIKGTQRTLVSLNKDPKAPFSALDDPEKLMELLRGGRPGYLLLRNPFDLHPPPSELTILQKNLLIESLLTVNAPNGQLLGPYLCRLRPSPLPFAIQ